MEDWISNTYDTFGNFAAPCIYACILHVMNFIYVLSCCCTTWSYYDTYTIWQGYGDTWRKVLVNCDRNNVGIVTYMIYFLIWTYYFYYDGCVTKNIRRSVFNQEDISKMYCIRKKTVFLVGKKYRRCIWEFLEKILLKRIKKIIGYFMNKYQEVSDMCHTLIFLHFLKYLGFTSAHTYYLLTYNNPSSKLTCRLWSNQLKFRIMFWW